MDSKEHIKTTAIKLFSEKGFDGVGVRDIAKEANVNIAMISYYFKSKEGLLENLVDDIVLKHMTFTEQVKSKEISPFEKLKLIINNSINDIIDNYQTSKIIFHENKIYKRISIQEKTDGLTEHIYTAMKEFILMHNPDLDNYKAEIIPLMIHSTLFEFVSNPSIIHFISKGKISNLEDPQKRNIIKEKLMEFMEDTTIRLIT